MTFHETMLRPFSRWLEPFPDESAFGFFRRLVANEEHNSAAVYAREIGLDGSHPDPEEILQTVLTLPMSETWKARLRNATPMVHGSRVWLAGQELRPRQVSITVRRYCPGCLHEAAYDRTWWDIVAVRQCPIHDEPILSRDEDGRVQRWWWPHPSESRWGGTLARRCQRTDSEVSIERYIVGRLGFGPPPSAPILDDFSLAEAIDACSFAGSMVSQRWPDDIGPAEVEQSDDLHRLGFSLLRGSRADFVEGLKTWIRTEVPFHLRERGYDIVFWPLNRTRRSFLSSQLSKFFWRAMRKAQSAAIRPEQRPFTEEEFYADDVGVVALAGRLNVQRYAVSDIARRVGVDPNRPSPRTKVRYAPDEVEKIEQFVRDLVTYEDAAKVIGLPRYQVKPLVDAGVLQSIPGVCGRRSLGLVRSEVDDLLRRTMEEVPVVPASGTYGLTTAASLMGVEPGLLATFVATGQIKPVGRKEGPLAFRNLRFTSPAVLPSAVVGSRKRKPRDRKMELGSRRLAAVRLVERVGMDESCSRLGLRRETLELWSDAFAERGLQGLCELKYEARHPQATPRSVAARVRALARKDSQNSCKRIEAILRKQGTRISSRTVWKIMKAAGLATAHDRQRAIDAKVQRSWRRGQ